MTNEEKTSPEESEPQCYFCVQSVRSQHWFDIDPDQIGDNFMTRETYFSK